MPGGFPAAGRHAASAAGRHAPGRQAPCPMPVRAGRFRASPRGTRWRCGFAASRCFSAHAAEEVPLSRGWTTDGVAAPQRRKEPGERDGRLPHAGKVVRGRFLSIDPGVDRPAPRKAVPRVRPSASTRGTANGRWGARRGSQVLFLFDEPCRPLNARQADDLVVAESEEGVVGSRRLDGRDRQVSPVRCLRLSTAAHQVDVDDRARQRASSGRTFSTSITGNYRLFIACPFARVLSSAYPGVRTESYSHFILLLWSESRKRAAYSHTEACTR